jgi:fumarate hydratase subunit beta
MNSRTRELANNLPGRSLALIRINAPLTRDIVKGLRTGDEVLLSGTILTARDAAHQRLAALIKAGKRLPVDLKDAVIYYCGPTPARPGMAIGSCGPTTSSRMDAFTPALLDRGVAAMIGKGDRSPEVIKAIRKNGCAYLLATGGAGALLATKVRRSKVVAFGDLGPEAIHELEVEDFPAIVGIDSKGRDIYNARKRKK